MDVMRQGQRDSFIIVVEVDEQRSTTSVPRHLLGDTGCLTTCRAFLLALAFPFSATSITSVIIMFGWLNGTSFLIVGIPCFPPCVPSVPAAVI
jgi:hypothetical protein